MPAYNKLISRAEQYIQGENLNLLKKAYEYAEEVYAETPNRLSGEPYISHPLAVANILAELQLDIHALIAGLLHKALRCQPPKSSEKELAKLFGKDVATIVSGATKIEDIQFKSRLDYKAENVKKMLLAMTKDIRVLLIKLADHLHDMQTLQFLSKERQQEMAHDTMDLYAPLSSRLGIDWIKRELEDLAFEYLYPQEFAELSNKIQMSLQERQDFVEHIKSILQKNIIQIDITDFRILGRPKHLYSIYRKLIDQGIPVEKVYDKVAFRIIVQKVSECYEVMGIVHSLWKPIASRFKDFISTPKSNMYQSLHTSVVGPHGDFMEIQIRTEEMDDIANGGIAAHWAYKEGAVISDKDARLFQWLKQLVQGLREVEDSREFLEAVKDELDHSEVYALTPNGDVKELPVGSTPLDFAYAIHTEVGSRCMGAKIDGKIVPLRHEIQSGDVIEILTSPNQHPNRRWLSLVKTRRAKNRIRHWLNQEEQAKALENGREICERELKKHNLSLKKIIKTGHFSTILKSFSCNTQEDLMRKIGSGKLKTSSIIDALQPDEIKEKNDQQDLESFQKIDQAPKNNKKRGSGGQFRIDGIEDMMVKISNCCMPMPGDSIMGFITAGRGVTVHKANCSNFLATDRTRHIDVEWSSGEGGSHRSKIQIVANDRKGLLVSICNVINGADADIIGVEAHSVPAASEARIDITMAVKDRSHLTTLLTMVRQLDGILEARRV